MTRGLATTLVLLVVGAVASGCLVQDPSGTFMCRVNKDCESGEVCGADHICYGNPPDLPLAAVLVPPQDRGDLAPTEITDFAPTSVGEFTAAFSQPITLAGRVVLADMPDATVSAHLVLRRASRIPGGPDLVITTTSQSGIAPGQPSFTLHVPPCQDGETYTVTIFPDATPARDSEGSPNVDQLAPPYRRTGFVFTTDVSDLTFPLGGGDGTPGKKRIVGRVISAQGLPLPGYDVRAYGRFSAADALELASSHGTTDAGGHFEVLVPVGWLDEFEVRLLPPAGQALPQIILPTVHVEDPTGTASTEADVGVVQLPQSPAPVPYTLSVMGAAAGGGTEAMRDATVTLTTLLEGAPQQVIYQATGMVDAEGDVILPLVPGANGNARGYVVDIAPAPGSVASQRWADPLALGPPGAQVELTVAPLRVLVAGELDDEHGLPATGVTLRVTPTGVVAAELATHAELRLEDVRWPETVTDDSGHFALWVDEDILGVALGYTVTFEPPAESLLPRSTLEDVYPVADATGRQDLGIVALPSASYARGTPTDPQGLGVPGMTMRVYERVEAQQPCLIGPCQPHAVLRAQSVAADDGHVRLVLPRL